MIRLAVYMALIYGVMATGWTDHRGGLLFAKNAKQSTAASKAEAASGPSDLARPKMMYADTASGKPYSKDPAVVKFQGRYWLYYSLPPYKGKPTKGWSIGIACSDNLADWKKVGAIKNEGETERNGFCAPGAIVLKGKIHLFYQRAGSTLKCNSP